MENLNETGIARVNYSNVEEENNNPIPIGGLTNPVVSRGPKDGEIAIDSADKLAKMGKSGYPLNGKYILTSDIDLSSFNNWAPIGTSSSKFTGSFNGNGYSITGLKINRSTDYVGLFGYTSGATIENVALENIDITGKDYTGGLVGYANSSTRISNSYAIGKVKGTSSTGGLAGVAASSTKITNSYWNTETTGQDESAGGLGKITSEMMKQTTYSGWDFANTWQIDEGVSYPTLR